MSSCFQTLLSTATCCRGALQPGNHLESLRRKRGAPAWAFFPEGRSHIIEGETGPNVGARYVVCAACHPGGLPKSAAESLCGGKQTGVFR